MRQIIARAGRWYATQLEVNPIPTKCITGGLLFGCGDYTAQRIKAWYSDTNKHFEWEAHRTLKMMVWGGCVNAFFGHHWYNLVEKLVPRQGITGIATKIALDQLTWTPCIDVAFLGTMALWNAKGVDGAIIEVQEKLWPTLVANWKVWPMFHVITYSLIPVPFRVLWTHCIGTCWSTFLSFMAYDYHDGEHDEESADKVLVGVGATPLWEEPKYELHNDQAVVRIAPPHLPQDQ